MFTLRRYWSLEGEVGRRSVSKRSQIGGVRRSARHGTARLLRHRAGHASSTIERLPAARNDLVGTRGWFRPVPAVRLGGSVAAYMPDLGRGREPVMRSIEVGVRRSVGARIRRTNRHSAGIAALWSSCIPSSMTQRCSKIRTAIVARIKWRSKPSATTTRAGTTFIAGKRKCSSAFPVSDRDNG